MREIIKMRLIHLKYGWKSILFWLLFPAFITIALSIIVDGVQDDVKVPVGIVLEEETPLAADLLAAIRATPLIRVFELDEAEALLKLKRHELDSVFIIRAGYAENVQAAKRERLIMSYQSDLSLAYMPVSEMIVSHVQADVSRFKAAHMITELSATYETTPIDSVAAIIEKSKLIQTEQSLLNSSFSFSNQTPNTTHEQRSVIKPWAVWSLAALLASFLLFDWVIRENHAPAAKRFPFMRLSLKSYLLKNAFILTIVLGIFDLMTLALFALVLKEPMTASFIASLLAYRLLISSGAFLFSLLFRRLYVYYAAAFATTLLTAIISGAVIPVDGLTARLPFLQLFNPFTAFLTGKSFTIWLIIFVGLILIWFTRKESPHA